MEHLAAVTQPGLSRVGKESLPLALMGIGHPHASARLRRPTPLAGHVVGPALTAVQQVIALGNQALVQLAGEQGDAFRPGVVPESNGRSCRPCGCGWSAPKQ